MKNMCLKRRQGILKWVNYVFLLCGLLFVKVIGEQQFTAMYVFGDSLVDNGNNNFINSGAKANFYPYGCDFYEGPTGRFTNGNTIIDYLSELIGIPYIPAFANPYATNINYGVNYASAAGGILEESGRALGDRFSFSRQVLNFNTTRNQLLNQMSEQELQQYLSKALAVVILGSNDYINNYLNPSYRTRSKFKPENYADLLIDQYTKQLMVMYDLGLRKFFLAGVGALGCTPSQRTGAKLPAGKCVNFSNDAPQMFNTRLRTLADHLTITHPNGTFVFGDTHGAIMDILDHPVAYGISVTERACCGVGRNNAEKMCLPLLVPCLDRDQYAFWDAFHPTQVVHRILAMKAYNGPNSTFYPFTLQQLAQL